MQKDKQDKTAKKRKKRKKADWSTLVIGLIFLCGLGLLAYPYLGNYWNSFHSSRASSSYKEISMGLPEEEKAAILKQAQEYNESLVEYQPLLALNEQEMAEYKAILNPDGRGIMGQIVIPAIDVDLPIYHTVEEKVLLAGSGHFPGSSFPIGGTSVHSIVSGHRGLASATLFTYLDELEIGDVFIYEILGQEYTYEIENIAVVEPHELDSLYIRKGQDLSTLVTCTPYGVNSHRMLITGHRIANLAKEVVEEQKKSQPIRADYVAAMIALILLILFLISLFIAWMRKKYKEEKRKSAQDRSIEENSIEEKSREEK